VPSQERLVFFFDAQAGRPGDGGMGPDKVSKVDKNEQKRTKTNTNAPRRKKGHP
jgi:hypothetical protein